MKLSIITINKNNLRGLINTGASLLSQTTNDFEWIIIDGGSTDGSVAYIKENEPRLHYWISKPDSGIYEAMNNGIDAATGDYLLFLHSGDCLASSDIVTSFYNLNPTADVIHGNTIIIDQDGNEVGQFIAPELVRLSFFWGHSLNHQGTFFHKRCFNDFRYNEKNRIASDTELYMQLLYYGYSFVKWDRYIERFELGGLSSQKNEDEFEGIVNRLLPPGVKADYDDILQFRDVDLYQLIRKIVHAPRWVRNLARVALLPFWFLLR